MKPVLRDWIDEAVSEGLIKTVKKQVDPVDELAAVGKKLEPAYGAMFTDVKGSPFPVVTGLVRSRQEMARALHMTYDELLGRFQHAMHDLTPAVMTKEGGDKIEIKKNKCLYDEVDLSVLPACKHHEKDSARYLTAALCIAKDPETGVRNVSIHRHEIKDRNHLGALLLPRHTFQMYSKAEKAGKPLEIALVIGVHPALLLASQATTPYGVDELSIAGTLLGEPVELVKCETVDIEVPRECEFVIEGKLLPEVRQEEGPFGEYPRTYGPKAPRHVIEVTGITWRDDPVYHTIIPATMEHLLLGGVSREAAMLEVIAQATPNVKKVHLTPASGCRYHVVLQIDKKHEGEAKNAIFAALTSSTEVKHVVAVDTDIDIFDPQDVEWAVANRVQASKDIFIIPSAMGNKLDPSSEDGVSDKMGIDATIPLAADRERYEKIRMKCADTVNLKDYLD